MTQLPDQFKARCPYHGLTLFAYNKLWLVWRCQECVEVYYSAMERLGSGVPHPIAVIFRKQLLDNPDGDFKVWSSIGASAIPATPEFLAWAQEVEARRLSND